MTLAAILMEQSIIDVKGGYKLPVSRSASVTISAKASAEMRNTSSGIVDAPAQITPSATPGNMYELLP